MHSRVMMTREIRGGCSCGAVRYRATGTPEMQGICHCRTCQRLSGGGHVGFICFPSGSVAIEGETAVTRGPGGSGLPAERHFCPRCHSALFGLSDMIPGKTNIYAGTLDDTAQFTPTIAIFTRSRQAWERDPPSLKCFETLPGG